MQNGQQARTGKTGRGLTLQHLLGVEGDAKPGGRNHLHVVCTIAHRNHLIQQQILLFGKLLQQIRLRLRVHNLPDHPACEESVGDFKLVGIGIINPENLLDVLDHEIKAAADERGFVAQPLERSDELRNSFGVRNGACDLLDPCHFQILEMRHALSQGFREIIPLRHRLICDPFDLGGFPGELGNLVDDLALDEGHVRVKDDQPLVAAENVVLLNGKIEGMFRFQANQCAHKLGLHDSGLVEQAELGNARSRLWSVRISLMGVQAFDAKPHSTQSSEHLLVKRDGKRFGKNGEDIGTAFFLGTLCRLFDKADPLQAVFVGKLGEPFPQRVRLRGLLHGNPEGRGNESVVALMSDLTGFRDAVGTQELKHRKQHGGVLQPLNRENNRLRHGRATIAWASPARVGSGAVISTRNPCSRNARLVVGPMQATAVLDSAGTIFGAVSCMKFLTAEGLQNVSQSKRSDSTNSARSEEGATGQPVS